VLGTAFTKAYETGHAVCLVFCSCDVGHPRAYSGVSFAANVPRGTAGRRFTASFRSVGTVWV